MIFNKKSFNRIVINGENIDCAGKSIIVNNGKVIVDGKEIKSNIEYDIKIDVYGDVNKLDCAGSVEVHGNCGSIDCSGSVICGNVTGDIDCSGSVICRK